MLQTPTVSSTPASSAASLETLLTRIIGEYREMPGLNLTASQAQRLWRLDESTCRSTLDLLVARGFLSRTNRGQYAKAR
jgi:hypothetical protein